MFDTNSRNSTVIGAIGGALSCLTILFCGIGAVAASPVPEEPGSEFSRGPEGGLRAENPAHRLTMAASADRLRFSLRPSTEGEPAWDLSFRLEGWGRTELTAKGLLDEPRITADRERLELDHGEIVEWFANRAQGVEHGFTVRSRLESIDAAQLRLEVELDTELLPDLSEDGQQIVFRTPAGTIALYYNKLVVTDAADRRLDARMAFVENRLQFVVDDADAVYPIEIDPLLTTIAWEETDDGQDRFGQRIGTFGDLDGDGLSDIFVYDDNRIYWYGGSTSGPVKKTLFNYDFGTNFTEIGDVDGDGIDDMIECSTNGYITTHYGDGAGDFSQGTGFDTGTSVGYWCGPAGDLNGDGNPDLWAVGSPTSSDTGQFSTWIFLGNGSTGFQPTPVAELPASIALATSPPHLDTDISAGDVNGDGYDDLLTGTNGGMQLYLGHSGGVSTTAAWSVTGKGHSVAIAGDLNCDTYADMVGTHVDTGINGADDAQLYIYTGSPSFISTSPFATITGYQGADTVSWGGLEVAPAGDVNGDGCADLLVGEPAFTYWSGDYLRGRASVWYGRPTLWQANSDNDADWIYFSTSAFLDHDELGWSVSAAGDINFDGYGDVLIGAPGYENVDNDDGRVLLFYGSAETLEPAASRFWRSSQGGEGLGTSAELVGDLNGDGYSDLIVGLPGFDGAAGSNTGRAYLFYGGSGTPGLGVNFAWEGEGANDYFGQVVDGAGDVNGDGYEDILIGAANANNGAEIGNGKAYLYFGGPGGPSGTPATVLVGTSPGDALGWSVASAGDVDRDGFGDVIVGAPFRSVQGVDGAGCAYIHYGTSTGLDPSRSETLCQQNSWASYGWDVASGDFNRDGFSDVAISEPFSTQGGNPYAGRVDVFLGGATGISTSPVRTLIGSQIDHFYGWSISGAGDVNNDRYSDLVIGGYGYDNGQNDEGQVEVRYGHPTLGVNSVTKIEINVANARIGVSVDSAGDVNGDFYSDIVVGAPGQGTRGTAYVFHGSSSGVSTSASWSAEGIQTGEGFGNWVSSGGDMDGDGFADIVVGSPQYDQSSWIDSGQVSFFAGNGDRVVRGTAVRQMYEDLSEPVARLGRANADDAFLIDMRTYHPAGKIDVTMQHQVRRLVDWYGAAVADGASSPILSGPTRIEEGIFNLNEQELYKWRARLKGDLPAFKFGRWFTMPGRGLQEASLQTDGCLDIDNDGYGYPGGPDCPGGSVFDNCPTVSNSNQANNDGDSAGDACDSDDDNDGDVDTSDNCPFDYNPNQADFDGDGIGDVCDPSADLDADGVLDGADNCMLVPNPAQADGDVDGFGDLCDNCPMIAQGDQLDADADGFGAACDCADTNGNVWSTPTAVDSISVQYFSASSQTLVQWGNPSDLGGSGAQASDLGFDVLASGDSDDFVSAAVCVTSDTAYNVHAVSFGSSGLPAGTTLEYYLVRAQNFCGEGATGVNDQGVERPASSCP